MLILSLVFGPDTVSTATMMSDLADGLTAHGHQVTVLTSMPHYNPSHRVRSDPRYRPPKPRLLTNVEEDGMRVIRVYMPLKSRFVWRRVIEFLWFHVITAMVGIALVRRADVVFVASPPITLGVSGYLLARLLGAHMIYDVRELWPDVPARMGLIRHKALIKLVYKLEQFVYSRSSAITSIARSFIDKLSSRGVAPGALYFTPNFVDVRRVKPGSKDNPLAREHGLVDKFVALYAGNIGLTQGLEILVDVARRLAEYEDVRVVIIGDGAARRALSELIVSAGPNNVMLLPFQPWERVSDVYATADVCLSPMRFGYSYDTVPSKIYTALAAARPVVAACEADSEAARLLAESGAGIVVTPEAAAEMATAILKLRADPELAHAMGQNGRNCIVRQYSRDAVVQTYASIIARVVAAA